MPHFAVSAIGRDRPGIAAAISRALLEVEGNIEDSQMSILRGHFAVMLIVSVGGSVSREDLLGRMEAVRAKLELEAVAVEPVDELADSGPGPTHVLSVYGSDHPGIVHAVTSALAERGIDITDLQTRLMGEVGKPLYVMLMEIAVGEGTDVEELGSALGEVGRGAGVDVSLRELEAETL